MKPLWILIINIYWAMALPSNNKMLLAFVSGFFVDIVLGQPLGISSLSYVIFIYIILALITHALFLISFSFQKSVNDITTIGETGMAIQMMILETSDEVYEKNFASEEIRNKTEDSEKEQQVLLDNRAVGEKSKNNAIISSSSSGLLPTRIYSKCKNPERTIIGHPFNPVYLLPAVEIVSGKKTSKLTIKKTFQFYKSISMNPIIVKNELPGYLSDRLQEALWREGLHIINEGYATTKDLDRAIEDGPGLRWSLMGTFLTFHLAGGNSGMSHMLEQFGPALKLPWTKLKAPKLTKKLVNKLVEGTKRQSKGKSVTEISNIRDEYLVELLKLRKKFEKKLR